MASQIVNRALATATVGGPGREVDRQDDGHGCHGLETVRSGREGSSSDCGRSEESLRDGAELSVSQSLVVSDGVNSERLAAVISCGYISYFWVEDARPHASFLLVFATLDPSSINTC